MNTLPRFLVLALCFVFGGLSAFLDIPILKPLYIVPICLGAIVWLTLTATAKGQPFNPSLRRLPALRWLTLGLLGFALTSCGTGTIVKFGEDGSIEVTPGTKPIVIPTK